MSKILKFSLSIEFSDSMVNKKDISEIANNIARAIKSEVNNGLGIAPADKGFTLSATIKSDRLKDEIKIEMF